MLGSLSLCTGHSDVSCIQRLVVGSEQELPLDSVLPFSLFSLPQLLLESSILVVDICNTQCHPSVCGKCYYPCSPIIDDQSSRNALLGYVARLPHLTPLSNLYAADQEIEIILQISHHLKANQGVQRATQDLAGIQGQEE